MSQNILCCGRKLSIEFAIRTNGSMPAKDFFDADLTESERQKFGPPMTRLADDGLVANNERFDKVKGTRDLWEFKLHRVGILGFSLSEGRFVLVHGLRKKKDRLPKSDIRVAEAIRKEHIARQSKG